MNPTSDPAGTTRRQLLRTGALGAAAAAVLAACSTQDEPAPGQSGTPTTTTEVSPTVPDKGPTTDQVAYDLTLLRTATSLELLAAELYGTYGPKLTSTDWAADAVRFSTDHTAAAQEFQDGTPAADRVTEPNAFVQQQSVDPVAADLTTDRAILDFLAGIERGIAATYIAAVGSYSEDGWRDRFAAYSSASARRAALLGNGGVGAPPNAATFDMSDLISNAAYLTPDAAGGSSDSSTTTTEAKN